MMFKLIRQFIFWFKLRRLKRQGLQIADDCLIGAMPDFGSEPYLISIAKRVRLSAKVTFITHDGGTWVFRDMPSCRYVVKYGRITILENCFIGYGATIMPGVTIGPNSVVGAGSLVTKDVPPNTIVAGHPAKILMSVDDYAEKCKTATPDYDIEAYARNKKQELLKVFPAQGEARLHVSGSPEAPEGLPSRDNISGH